MASGRAMVVSLGETAHWDRRPWWAVYWGRWCAIRVTAFRDAPGHQPWWRKRRGSCWSVRECRWSGVGQQKF